jgi:hypothetical protein
MANIKNTTVATLPNKAPSQGFPNRLNTPAPTLAPLPIHSDTGSTNPICHESPCATAFPMKITPTEIKTVLRKSCLREKLGMPRFYRA